MTPTPDQQTPEAPPAQDFPAPADPSQMKDAAKTSAEAAHVDEQLEKLEDAAAKGKEDVVIPKADPTIPSTVPPGAGQATPSPGQVAELAVREKAIGERELACHQRERAIEDREQALKALEGRSGTDDGVAAAVREYDLSFVSEAQDWLKERGVARVIFSFTEKTIEVRIMRGNPAREYSAVADDIRKAVAEAVKKHDAENPPTAG